MLISQWTQPCQVCSLLSKIQFVCTITIPRKLLEFRSPTFIFLAYSTNFTMLNKNKETTYLSSPTISFWQVLKLINTEKNSALVSCLFFHNTIFLLCILCGLHTWPLFPISFLVCLYCYLVLSSIGKYAPVSKEKELKEFEWQVKAWCPNSSSLCSILIIYVQCADSALALEFLV